MKPVSLQSIALYQQQAAQPEIRQTYQFLIKYVMSLKADLEQQMQGVYSCGNVSPGYMDYTYFSFFNADLRRHKLRYGIVFNHIHFRFELWLMGQNAAVQKAYWAQLKTAKWNQGRSAMPQYSVLEVVLVDQPDFRDLQNLSQNILQAAKEELPAIQQYLETHCLGI